MQRQAPVTVAIAAFEDLVARGLSAILAEDRSVELVAFGIEHARLASVLRAHRPQVAILSFGALECPSQVRQIRGAHPETHLVLLANHPSGAECAQMLAFGASACLGKGTQARDIVNAVHLAARGLQLFPRSESRHEDPATAAASELLTSREAEVLGLLRDGRQNAQIAVELHISVETVRTHARNIYRKLGVSSRRELLTPPSALPPLHPPVRAQPPRWAARGAAVRRRGHS